METGNSKTGDTIMETRPKRKYTTLPLTSEVESFTEQQLDAALEYLRSKLKSAIYEARIRDVVLEEPSHLMELTSMAGVFDRMLTRKGCMKLRRETADASTDIDEAPEW